jgi:hypothetical protein
MSIRSESIPYYLSLLESKGIEPYISLARELAKLPELTNATAVAKIIDLALNATNQEIKDAFDLMVKCGTPNQKDFAHAVPSWNVQVWGLYHLAEDIGFERDDVIALSIAIVDGVFRVVGDDQVRSQVRRDGSNMLRFSRNVMTWQKDRGMIPLSHLPLDAALHWAWRGTTTMCRSGKAAYGGGPYPLQAFVRKKMTIDAYLWDTIGPNTLRDMAADAERLGWCKSCNIDSIVGVIEDYLYFSKGQVNWEYHYVKMDGTSDTISNVDGVDVEFGEVQNTDWLYYQRFKKGLPGVGCCVAETAFVDAWLKSVGISCNSIGRAPKYARYTGHGHAIYYDPILGVWKAYDRQVQLGLTSNGRALDVQVLRIRVLPINCVFDRYYVLEMDLGQIRSMFVQVGVSSAKIKEWLLRPLRIVLTLTAPQKAIVGTVVNITATLRNETGKPIAGVPLIFYVTIDGSRKIIGSANTDTTGSAWVMYVPGKAREVEVEAIYTAGGAHAEILARATISLDEKAPVEIAILAGLLITIAIIDAVRRKRRRNMESAR